MSSNIQKANPATWWVGTSPKHYIKKRIQVPAGYTNEESEKYMQRILNDIDKREDKEIEKELYKLSDEYARSKLQSYKHIEVEALKKEIQELRNRNNQTFAGGYTGPAIQWVTAQDEYISKQEEAKKAEIEKKFDGSKESLDYIRKLMEDDEIRNNYRAPRSNVTRLVPRVGGAAARHAMIHGGGFNHRKVYAPNVFK